MAAFSPFRTFFSNRHLEHFEAIFNYPSSSTFVIFSRIEISADLVFLPTLFFFFLLLDRASVGGNCFESTVFPSGNTKIKRKLKSKLAGVNCNSISFQFEQVEAPRTSMELQREETRGRLLGAKP